MVDTTRRADLAWVAIVSACVAAVALAVVVLAGGGGDTTDVPDTRLAP